MTPNRRAAHSALLAELDDSSSGRMLDPLEYFVETAWRHLAPTGVSWLGFYRWDPAADSLVLAARRDRPACSPIGLHGVCGQSLTLGRTRIVADVGELGSDYVACDARDRSEIVIPAVWGTPGAHPANLVLDLDSFEPAGFDDDDDRALREALARARITPVAQGSACHGPLLPQ
ncbi:MAG: hypothetical protein CMJ51_01795 [Planctomycetaceae bacterium]|nr:hypothetical protein [Planctomycetaceae bacterium]